MQISGLSPIGKTGLVQPSETASAASISAVDVSKGFSNMLDQAIQTLEQQQSTVEHLNTKFVVGQLADVHQMTIAAEKAVLGVQLAVTVRNKAIEAYQEVMRTQI